MDNTLLKFQAIIYSFLNEYLGKFRKIGIPNSLVWIVTNNNTYLSPLSCCTFPSTEPGLQIGNNFYEAHIQYHLWGLHHTDSNSCEYFWISRYLYFQRWFYESRPVLFLGIWRSIFTKCLRPLNLYLNLYLTRLFFLYVDLVNWSSTSF